MNPAVFDSLDQFKTTPVHALDSLRVFYAPVDDVHGVLRTLIAAAEQRIDLAMFGFDDDELAALLREKQRDGCAVRLVLDKTQAAGRHERHLLDRYDFAPGSVLIGRSEHGAIMHLKLMVIDGVITVGGSCNWSDRAERDQDNEVTVIHNAAVAAEARARINAIAAHIASRTPRARLAAFVHRISQATPFHFKGKIA